MPLEDLTELGYEVARAPLGPDGEQMPGGSTVWGHDKQWFIGDDDDEEAVVAEARNHHKIWVKMEQAQTYFAENYANWPTMTAQQKDAANRQAQRGLANLIRHVRKDLSSEGV
jgi:hypothetical protein